MVNLKKHMEGRWGFYRWGNEAQRREMIWKVHSASKR